MMRGMVVVMIKRKADAPKNLEEIEVILIFATLFTGSVYTIRVG